jgi:phospholipid transport system substrate-binding protein
MSTATMKTIRHLLILVLAFAVASPAMAASKASAPPPSPEVIAEATLFVQGLADETIASLSDETLGDDMRRAQFEELIERGFASDYISKVVVGRYWRKMTPEQRTDYLSLFHTFMLDSLMSRLSVFNDEYFDILGHNVTKKGDIFILSKIVTSSQSFDVDWRVRRIAGAFKIIDVRLEGISMVITNHEEVTSIAFADGIEGLLQSLRDRTTALTGPAVPVTISDSIN